MRGDLAHIWTAILERIIDEPKEKKEKTISDTVSLS